MIEHFVSVDIGSTWTKAARFALHEDRFFVEKRSVVPTTIDHLPDGFYSALNLLDRQIDWAIADSAPMPVVFSSSARGGLKVAVVGLVPEMSLQIARLAACSAGAKVVGAFPYRLTRSCVAELEQMRPDILLLCGGTDGGNERYVSENATAISRSRFDGTIVYAGNSQAAEIVSDNLSGRDLRICENLMPDFGRLNIEPARSAIRDVFLDRIVAGKGLEKLVSQFGIAPLPTPLAVFNLVDAIGRNLPDWQNFALIDMGGATTDIYSFTEAYHQAPATVLKGITEPRLKRSVEGDLGMRVSASSVVAVAEKFLRAELDQKNICFERLIGYVEKLELNHSFLPDEKDFEESLFDELLARACISQAVFRHAGTVERVFTAGGPILAQYGKDLRHIDRIVGSGGYLAAEDQFSPGNLFCSGCFNDSEKTSLVPENFSYFCDHDYLWPLLGNLASRFPAQAANTAVLNLRSADEGESAFFAVSNRHSSS
ncbi:MAG: glutamate mutase L, partial [Candidatus Rifleibacteriota bacterium]